MTKPDALLLRAVRETADSLNDALQIVLLEGAVLYGAVKREGVPRLDTLMTAARKAACLSKAIFGGDELVTDEVATSQTSAGLSPGADSSSKTLEKSATPEEKLGSSHGTTGHPS
ncbi:MAG: hypothetical protein L0387_42390 [Acidobacteria bacterium]|nr:hypothetical protein [Acidobacteriota bacterium]